jgi:hypothetical protein
MTDSACWSDYLRQTLARYDDSLLRLVAGRLFKPRNQWPAEELIDRSVATVGNAAVVDRRLQDLGPAERRLLSVIGHSRQPRWRLGSLLELLAALGHAEGPQPVLHLFEAGLLYPDLLAPVSARAAEPGARPSGRLRSFEQWLGQARDTGFTLFAHPQVTARALGEDLGLPDPSAHEGVPTSPRVQEADGLEWPLRLAVLWQLAAASPLRRTQLGEFFKRDFERLRGDSNLNAPSPDALVELPDPGLLAVALAMRLGILQETDGELRAAAMPSCWEAGLLPVLESLFQTLPHLDGWDAHSGWQTGTAVGNPFPAAHLLALLLLARMPADAWARPADVAAWVVRHHPYWAGGRTNPAASSSTGSPTHAAAQSEVTRFLLGLAYGLRLVQVAKDLKGDWLLRLGPVGRWLLGLAEPPASGPVYAQTLLVQPNLEVVVYRQGLTPTLIARLSRVAAWKTLGSACTLQLQPESVYRALEAGETFESISRLLEQHGMRPLPPAVADSLRTWANKRERITVFPSATLFEFASGEELNDALARGLPALRLAERLAVVANEAAVDFRHFRLTSSRDYALPPEKCVAVEDDGVTLTIDLSRSDLLLETELQRFAELLPRSGAAPARHGPATRQYRVTPASLTAGRSAGLSVRGLDDWFLQRTGQPLSPAVRLLLTASQMTPVELRRRLVLSVPSADLADGLQQWPETRALIEARLGPTALVVATEHVELLRQRLAAIGVQVQWSEPEA